MLTLKELGVIKKGSEANDYHNHKEEYYKF